MKRQIVVVVFKVGGGRRGHRFSGDQGWRAGSSGCSSGGGDAAACPSTRRNAGLVLVCGHVRSHAERRNG